LTVPLDHADGLLFERRLATRFVVGWILVLVGLAALWTRSPFLGTSVVFGAWSAPAALLTWATWHWMRRLALPQVRIGRTSVVLVTGFWVLALVTVMSDLGPTLALDGLIMRRDSVRLAGRLVGWMPLAFGGCLSVAGLAASLEARYWILRTPGTRPTPPDPAR
jgi:hypothetical protein